MKREQVVGVSPALLRWARESLGLSTMDVASRLKRQPDEIDAWENGKDAPTYSQLEALAYEIYKRPLAIFFLPEPPVEAKPQQEFRTLSSSDVETLTPDTLLHLRKAHAYQLSLADFYEGINPSREAIWNQVSLSIGDDVVAKALNIRSLLGITIEMQARWAREDASLRNWRAAIESRGVFVFKDSFKQSDISGFCLNDDVFPIIYINNGTTKTRQTFSLLHELAHILFKINGISKFDISYIDRLSKSQKAIEVFCNAVASEVLIPSEAFEKLVRGLPFNVEGISDEIFSGLASQFGVSREAILRRFLDRGRSSQVFYEAKAEEWASQRKTGAGGGGDWYATKGSYLSNKLLIDVFSRHLQNQISAEQAAFFLGIKAKNLGGLEEIALKRMSA